MDFSKHALKITLSSLLVLIASGIGLGYFLHPYFEEEPISDIADLAIPGPEVVPIEELYPYVIAPNTTLYTSLKELNVPSPVIHQIAAASKPIFNLSRINPGIRFQIFPSEDPNLGITGIKFRFSAVEMMEIKLLNGVWSAEKITEAVETRVVTFSGFVTSSLWDSASKAQMDPNLIADLAEIFAWQVDFSREVQVNDKWRLTVEQKMVKGEPIGWGSILAAEYTNSNETHTAVLFRNDGQDLGYFAPDGSNLRRMFLKSPIRYGRISSRFQRARFHPILRTKRAHLGVDYAAPTGTPIRAVGDGTVAMAKWSGGGGRVIKIRHNSVYETAYKHLSRFAKGIRAGARVQQGQIIGYVGSTGLSTGPHLHFEFFQAGRYVDPLGKKFPSADPVPKKLMSQFQAESLTLLSSLPQWGSSQEVSLQKTDQIPATATNTEAAKNNSL